MRGVGREMQSGMANGAVDGVESGVVSGVGRILRRGVVSGGSELTCSWTWVFSSANPSRKLSSSSSALSILSAYSPMIQIMDALHSICIGGQCLNT